MMLRVSLAAVSALALSLLTLAGRLDVARAQPLELRGSFVVRTIAGVEERGEFAALTSEFVGLRTSGNGPLKKFAWEQIVTLRAQEALLPIPPPRQCLVLTNGDRLRADLLAGDDSVLRFRTYWRPAQEITVPIAKIRSYWMQPPHGEAAIERSQRLWEQESLKHDAVLTRSGDRVQGIWESCNAKELALRERFERRTLLREEVSALGFAAASSTPMEQPQASWRLVLADGSRITLKGVEWRIDGTVRGDSLWGTSVTLPLVEVIAIEPMWANRTSLLTLPFIEKTERTLDLPSPVVRDGAVAGDWLRVGGDVYDKGLGVPTGATLTFRLKGDEKALLARLALDPRAGGDRRAQVILMLDGKQARPPLVLESGKDPVWLRLELGGAKKLEISAANLGGRVRTEHVHIVDAWLLHGE
jgi:hypothetical protein